jgi:uncharacterized repeat protein (TIGR01451 family)
VYPVKIADPYKIPPGPATVTVDFEVMVINWGSIPPAELTLICDFLPADMTYVPGSANQGGTFGSCPDPDGSLTGDAVYWKFDPPRIINQGGFTLPSFTFQANAQNTVAGQVLTNEVRTWGDNIDTAVFYRPVYVFTPTPTSTPTGVPTANDDFYAEGDIYPQPGVDEDNVLIITDPLLGVLGNDVDLLWNGTPDVLQATVIGGTGPWNGTLSFNLDGTFTYSPNVNYFGSDTFDYQACDLGGLCDSATVQIIVNSVEDVPTAIDDTYTILEDDILQFASPGLRVNDSDGDDFVFPFWDTLTVNTTPVSTPDAGGFLTLYDTGAIFYVPLTHNFGLETFVYEVCDPGVPPPSLCSTATVSITIIEVNDPPIADDDDDGDGAFVDEDSSVTIDVLANDIDGDPVPDPLSVQSVTDPPNGTAVNNGSDVTYTPDADFNGTDSFDYIVSDGRGGTDTATVTVRVDPVNDVPTAVDDAVSTNEDTPITINVLANDPMGNNPPPVPGDGLGSVAVMSGPANGITVVNGDYTITYTPDPNYFSPILPPVDPDTFTYQVCDVDGPPDCDTATVAVTVNEVNDPPTANDDDDTDGAFVNEDEWVTIDVLANDVDGDPLPIIDILSVQSVTDPPNGTVVNNGGDVTYTPDADFNGIDTFQYTVSDGRGGTDTATVTVRVDPVNDVPTAANDSVTTNEDVPVTINVLANDPMGNNPPPAPGDGFGSLTVISGPTNGSATVNLGNTITYDPAPLHWFGSDSFVYELCDADLPADCDQATVSLTVNEVNDPPTANDDDDTDGAFVDEDAWVTIDVLANDVDGDPIPDPLTVQSVTDPPNGTVVNNGGDVTYTPDADFNGTDTFQYTVSDGRGGTDTAIVTVRVDPIDDPPVAFDDAYYTGENVAINIPAPGVLGNDQEYDGESLTATQTSGDPINRNFTFNADGSFFFEPRISLSMILPTHHLIYIRRMRIFLWL